MVIKPCCIGDVVQATAVVQALKQRWPALVCTVATNATSAPVVRAHPAVSGIIDAGNPGVRSLSGWRSTVRLWRNLCAGMFDLAVVPDRSPVLAAVTFLARIPVRVGLDSGGRGRLYTFRVAPAPDEHELYQAGQLVKLLGIETLPSPTFHASEAACKEAATLVAPFAGRPIALVAPGGGENAGTTMTNKRWTPQGFASVANSLRTGGYVVLVVGGPGDVEVASQVVASSPGAINLAGQLPLDVAGALQGQAAVFVGNDSGLSHLAAAAGCPTVAIFGPTSPSLYAPRGTSVEIVAPRPGSRRRGAGTVRDPFEFDHAWQQDIHVDQVITAIERVIS